MKKSQIQCYNALMSLLLEPEIRSVSGETMSLQIERLGIYKNTYWEFQKEWRYRMVFTPFNIQNGVEYSLSQFIGSVNRMAQGVEPPPIRHFDLEIAQEHFEKMEITPSPQMTAGNRILLEALVEKYNPSALIKESELKELI